jgi:hypothetical protein
LVFAEAANERLFTSATEQDRANFVAREDDREALRALRAYHAVRPGDIELEHLAVAEEQRAERLVLRGGRDSTVNCQ